MNKKLLCFPGYNVSVDEAVSIVKFSLGVPDIPEKTKVLAISHVADMGTHNSVTKNELISALRWLFKHYDFVEA